MRATRSVVVVAALLVWALAWASGCSKGQEEEQPAQPGETRQPVGRQAQQRKKALEPRMIDAPAEYLRVVTVDAREHAIKTLATVELSTQIQKFNALKGRYPESLEELGEWRGGKLPDLPRGLRYDYNPQTGELKLVPEP